MIVWSNNNNNNNNNNTQLTEVTNLFPHLVAGPLGLNRLLLFLLVFGLFLLRSRIHHHSFPQASFPHRFSITFLRFPVLVRPISAFTHFTFSTSTSRVVHGVISTCLLDVSTLAAASLSARQQPPNFPPAPPTGPD